MTAASLISGGAYDRNNRRSPRNRAGKGIALFLDATLTSTTPPTTFIRLNLDATSAHPNPDVLHTVRIGRHHCLRLISPATSRGADIRQVNGEPIVVFRAAPGSEEDSYTLHRNGVLITRTKSIRYLAQRSNQSARYPDTPLESHENEAI